MAPEKKKRVKKNIQTGLAYVLCSFNNTIVTITDVSGNVLSWSSAGLKGFRGSKKSTPYAAQMAAEDAGKKAQEYGLKTLSVFVKGPGNGREAAIRGFASVGYNVTLLRDITPIPHNGCRPKKKRRV
jgi:small subunit ribosomal protein S11